MKSEVKCLICGDSNTANFRAWKEVSISVCKEDGLVFMNPRWSKEQYTKYYQDSYKESAHAIVLKPQSPSCNLMWSLISKNDVSKISNVLDIGAASGSLLERMRIEIGDIALHGIEPFRRHAEEMEKRGVKVVAYEAEDKWQNVPAEGFDLITMRHVLEHFLNPVKVLQKLRSNLTKDGLICLEVPNCEIPLGNAQQYFILPHTYYFSTHTLKHIATKAGLEVVDCFVPPNNKHVIQATFKNSTNIEIYEIPKGWAQKQIEIVKKVPGVTSY